MGAIGAVRATDVLTLELDNVDVTGPQPGITTARDVLPAGLPALQSFGELVTVAVADVPGVAPNEIQVGLHPERVLGERSHVRWYVFFRTPSSTAGLCTTRRTTRLSFSCELSVVPRWPGARSSAARASSAVPACPSTPGGDRVRAGYKDLR
jgi:hypothetical protein